MTTKIYIAKEGNLNSQEVYSHSLPEISVTVRPWNYDLAKRLTNQNYWKEKKLSVCQTEDRIPSRAMNFKSAWFLSVK